MRQTNTATPGGEGEPGALSARKTCMPCLLGRKMQTGFEKTGQKEAHSSHEKPEIEPGEEAQGANEVSYGPKARAARPGTLHHQQQRPAGPRPAAPAHGRCQAAEIRTGSLSPPQDERFPEACRRLVGHAWARGRCQGGKGVTSTSRSWPREACASGGEGKRRARVSNGTTGSSGDSSEAARSVAARQCQPCRLSTSS